MPGRCSSRVSRWLLGVAVGTLTTAGALAPAVVASDSAAAAVPSAAKTGCAFGTGAAVAEAYSVVFSTTPGQTDPAVSTAERTARIQGGDDPALAALVARWLAAQAGPGGTVVATDVTCVSNRRARAHTELQLGGTPMPKVMPEGGAVLDGAVWKVSRATFCERMRIEDPALASAGACAVRRANRSRPLPPTTVAPSRTTSTSTTTTTTPAPEPGA